MCGRGNSGLRLPCRSASYPVVTSGRGDRADGRDPITSDHFPERRRSRAAQGQTSILSREETISHLQILPSVSPVTAPGGRVSIRSHPINPIRSSPAGGVRELHGSDRASLGNDRAGRCIPPPLGAEPSRAGRLEGVRVFSGTAGTCRVRVRNPGALRGRLGAGVVAYVPRYGAYVTLSRAPRETAVFPVHCLHRITSGRYASAAYTPVCGGTTGNMPRIPAGGVLRYASVCVGMVHL